MSHFYVPIEYSKANTMVPEEEEIIYSTLCFITYRIKEVEYWESHVLFTNRSVLFTKGKYNNPEHLYYLPWSSIKYIGKGKFDSTPYYFTLKRDKQLETEEDFLKRSAEFKSFIKPVREKGKKYWKTNFPSRFKVSAEVKRIIQEFLNSEDQEN